MLGTWPPDDFDQLHALELLRRTDHRVLVSGLPPYPLSPPPLDSAAADPADDSPGSLISELESRDLAAGTEHESAAETSMPADREAADPGQTGPSNEESLDPGAPPNLSSQLLHYQDGALVAPANEHERRAFLRYRETSREDPSSLSALRNWYAKHNPG